MKLFYPLALVLIGAIIWTLTFSYRPQPPALQALLQAKSATGSEENPRARAEFEWMRLRDPASGRIPQGIREKELRFAETLPVRAEGLYSSDGRRVQALSNWTPRGPYNVGGRTRALAYDISDTTNNTLLAGGVAGGIWRSIDGGASWTKTTGAADLHSVTALAQDTRAGQQHVWYAGTGEFSGNSASGAGGQDLFLGNGIYKSTNGGVTWALLPSTRSDTPQTIDPFDLIHSIAVKPDDGSVYVATFFGILRSPDGEASWERVLGGAEWPQFSEITSTSTGVLYATLSSFDHAIKGVFRSTDGMTWTDITPDGFPGFYTRIVTAVAPSNEDVVYVLGYAGTGEGPDTHFLWKYTYRDGDGAGSGGNWEDRSTNLPAFGGEVGDFDSQGGYDLVVAVKPDDEHFVLIGGTNLYRSTDGFATPITKTDWIGGYSTVNDISGYPIHHADQHVLVFEPGNPDVLISGHDGGLSKTTDISDREGEGGDDTVDWVSLNNGYYTTQFYTVCFEPNATDHWVAGGMQDNGTWLTTEPDETAEWAEALSGDGAFCAMHDTDAGTRSLYASVQNGIVVRTVVNMADFEAEGQTLVQPAEATDPLFINPFVLDPNDGRMMYYPSGNQVWRNDDLEGIALGSGEATSTNWTLLASATLASGPITAIDVSKANNANVVYYGNMNGEVYRLDAANVGATPVRTEVTGAAFPAAWVNSISVDPTNSDDVVVVFSNYNVPSVWHTTDGGATWTDVSGNLEENPDGSGNGPSVRSIAILPRPGHATVYYLGTSTGLYSTEALNGASTVWSQEGGSTIGNVVVDMVKARTGDRLVIAGTHANGVYSTTAPLSTEIEDAMALPDVYRLSAAAPSPFYESTSFTLAVSTTQQVRAEVVNAAGQRVAVLHDGIWPAHEERELRFEARDLTGGVYFLRITGETFSTSRSAVLIR